MILRSPTQLSSKMLGKQITRSPWAKYSGGAGGSRGVSSRQPRPSEVRELGQWPQEHTANPAMSLGCELLKANRGRGGPPRKGCEKEELKPRTPERAPSPPPHHLYSEIPQAPPPNSLIYSVPFETCVEI